MRLDHMRMQELMKDNCLEALDEMHEACEVLTHEMCIATQDNYV